MSGALVGGYVPGNSPVHRWGPGTTYLVILIPSLISLGLRTWWAALGLVIAAIVLLVATRIPPRIAFAMPTSAWILLAVLGAVQLASGDWRSAVVVVGNLYGCLAMSRVLTLTTPLSDLMDALVRFVGPLRRIGVNPERFGLAVGLTMRSVPWLIDSVATVRQAARVRGVERRWDWQVTPVVVAAVAHAQATGEALAARGLGDSDPEPAPLAGRDADQAR